VELSIQVRTERCRIRCAALCNYMPPSTTSYERTGYSGTFFPSCRAANNTLNTTRSSCSTDPTPSTSNKENHPQRPTGSSVRITCSQPVLNPGLPNTHTRNVLQLQPFTAIPVRSTVKSLWKMELCASLSIKCLNVHSAAIENFALNWYRVG